MADAEPIDRRHQIAEAAAACFARSGFQGASMQEICAAAGMSAGALYRYFPGKAAIVLHIAESERQHYVSLFAPLATAADPLAALCEIGRGFLAAHFANGGGLLTADVIAEAGRNPEVRAAFEANAKLVRDMICGALRRGQGNLTVDPALDIEAACHLLMSLGDGLCAQRVGSALPPERVMDAMDLLLTRFFRPPQ